MIKESNENVDDRVKFSERNLPVSRPLTPSVTTSLYTTANHLCSSLCSPPLLPHQFICVIPLLILDVERLIHYLLHQSPTPCLLRDYVSRRSWRPMFFFQQYYNFRENPSYIMGEIHVPRMTPLCCRGVAAVVYQHHSRLRCLSVTRWARR